MKRFPRLVVFFLALALIMGPPIASMAAQSTKKVIDDSTITTEVKAKLAKDSRIGTLTGIEVNTTNGVVTLAGKVKSKAEKKKVAKIAKSVKGVKKVQNNLQVVP